MILAPLRGVTIRCFRRTFAEDIAEAGFTEAVTPFITAMPGFDPLRDRELKGGESIMVTPQFIAKDPVALRECLLRVKSAGYGTADLNAGCPFPMVRNKGRGAGLLRTPNVLRRLLEVGCEVMGEGRFSLKTRLGVERTDELISIIPMLNEFPLRRIVIHARTACQMYNGKCDMNAFGNIVAATSLPVVYNGDVSLSAGIAGYGATDVMVGRSFIRSLGMGTGATKRLMRYIATSTEELQSEQSVLGRLKEIISYWKDLPMWRRRWQVVKLARSLAEMEFAIKD